MPGKIAVEYERTTCNKDGSLAQAGVGLIIANPGLYHHEGTQAQFEWNSQPHQEIARLRAEYLAQEATLQQATEYTDILPIPGSENGAGPRGLPNLIRPNVKVRIEAYQKIIGEKNEDHLTPWSGIHFHLDASQERFVDQYNALQAIAKVASAFTSTSPLDFQGKNGINCQRQDYIQHRVFLGVPEEHNYITTKADLMRRNEARVIDWKNKYVQQGGDPEVFDRYFSLDNTGYIDVRYRPNIGDGTMELRTYDTAPGDVLIDSADLLQGYDGRIIDEHIPVEIAKKDHTYQFNNRKIILPNWDTLVDLHHQQIKAGLEAPAVNRFLEEIVHFARRPAPSLRTMLATGKNPASKLQDYLQANFQEKNGRYTREARKKGNLFLWELQQQANNSLKQ